MPFSEDMNRRINQALAEAGVPVVMPEDWDDVNAMAEQMDAVAGKPVSVLERYPTAQAVAMEMMRRLLTEPDEIEYDTRWCPEFDESKPETMSRYYALVKGCNVVVPLASIDQWVDVGRSLSPSPLCNAHIAAACYRQIDVGDVVPEDPPVAQVAVVRGEMVCIFNICVICYGALQELTFEDWPDYSGPFLWYDDGNRDDNDPWA